MRFGNASWGFRETTLEEQLKVTSEMNLKILELGIANAPADISLDASTGKLLEVHRLFEKYGVELICAATGNDFTNGSDADVKKVKRIIDICVTLRIQYLRIFAGFSPVEDVIGERWDNMIKCLREVGAYAKGKVTLAIETHGGVTGYDDGVKHFHSVTTVPETLKRIIVEIPEDIKFLYDPANLWAVGYKNPADLLGIIKGRLALVHLKDFKLLPSGHLKPAACGDSSHSESGMDWEIQLQALGDFDIPALFEYENTEDVAEGCKRCRDYICEMI